MKSNKQEPIMYVFPDRCTAEQIESLPGKVVFKDDHNSFYVIYGNRIAYYELGADNFIKTDDYTMD